MTPPLATLALCLAVGLMVGRAHQTLGAFDRLASQLAWLTTAEYDVRLCAELTALRRNLRDAGLLLESLYPENATAWHRARQSLEEDIDAAYIDAILPDAKGHCTIQDKEGSPATLTPAAHAHYQGHAGWPAHWPNAVARLIEPDELGE